MDEVELQLEALGRRLIELGYGYREAKYFSDNGIIAFPAAQPGTVEESVFLYERRGVWVARVTSQAGAHWVRQVPTCAELEALALEALRSPKRPPARGWLLD